MFHRTLVVQGIWVQGKLVHRSLKPPDVPSVATQVVGPGKGGTLAQISEADSADTSSFSE